MIYLAISLHTWVSDETAACLKVWRTDDDGGNGTSGSRISRRHRFFSKFSKMLGSSSFVSHQSAANTVKRDITHKPIHVCLQEEIAKVKRWDYITIYDLVERIFCQILPWKWMPHSRFFRHILLVNWLVNIFRKTISHSSAHFASIQCNKLDTSVNFLCKNSKNVIHDDNLYALLTIRTSEINKVNCAEAVGGIIITSEKKNIMQTADRKIFLLFLFMKQYIKVTR